MSTYDDMVRQAERLRNNFRDLVDQPNEREAQYLRSEIEGLISELKAKKNGDAIERRLKNMEHHFKQLNQEVMDFRHSDQLAGMCEDMLHHTREL